MECIESFSYLKKMKETYDEKESESFEFRNQRGINVFFTLNKTFIVIGQWYTLSFVYCSSHFTLCKMGVSYLRFISFYLFKFIVIGQWYTLSFVQWDKVNKFLNQYLVFCTKRVFRSTLLNIELFNSFRTFDRANLVWGV